MVTLRTAKRYLAEWVEILQLQDVVIKVRIRNIPWQNQSQDWANGSDGSARTAIITLSKNQSPEDLFWSLGHELSHIITDYTFERYSSLLETLTRSTVVKRQMYKDYNGDDNRVIEWYLRIIYKLLAKTYPAHRNDCDLVTGPVIQG